MKRLCARATPGDSSEGRQRAPRADRGGLRGVAPPGERRRRNATPVQVGTGRGVILSQGAWRANQRARTALDLLVATGEAANG